MILKINGEQAFQINASSFTISPSQTDYVLQVSADGQSFSDLFAVSANTTRMITNVANGAFYRLKNNEGEVSINWKRECGSEASIPTEIRAIESLPLMAEEGTVAATEEGVFQFKNGEWVAVGGSEEGTVKSVNGIEPDENGNVAIDAHSVGTLNSDEILAIREEALAGFESMEQWVDINFVPKTIGDASLTMDGVSISSKVARENTEASVSTIRQGQSGAPEVRMKATDGEGTGEVVLAYDSFKYNGKRVLTEDDLTGINNLLENLLN